MHIYGQNLSNGLVGFYPFNGNAGDSSGLSPINHGTINGATFACGVLDSAIVFDGVNDRVKLDSNFHTDSSLTVSFWVNPHAVHLGSMFAMRKQCTSTGRGWERFNFALSGNNTWAALSSNANVTVTNQLLMVLSRCHNNCNGWSNRHIYTIPGLTIDTLCFTHIVISAEDHNSNANRNYTVYINGQYYADTLCHIPSASNLAATTDPHAVNASDFETFFGMTHDNFSYATQQTPYDGALDHVRVYSRKVTAAEALALYQEGLSANAVSLTYSDTSLCTGETDTVAAPALDACDFYYWTINDSVVNSTDTFLVMTGGGTGLDTVSLIYAPKNICMLDTLSVIYTIGAADSIFDTASICLGDSAFVGGAWQTTSGVYMDTVSSTTQCDTINITQLYVIDNVDTQSVFICPGDSFSFGGNTLYASGTYTNTISGTPCDTVHVLELSVGNPGAGLVGYYPLGINAGDSSTLAPLNNGTLNGGVTFASGVVGNAAFFDGVNDHVVLDSNFDLTSSYTFSAWVKPASSHVGSIFSMRRQCTVYGGGFNHSLIGIGGPGGTGSAPFYTNNSAFTTYNQLVICHSRVNASCTGWHSSSSYTVPGVPIDTTCWTHIVVVATENSYDSTRSFDIYINGQWYADTNHQIPSAANYANAVNAFTSGITGYKTYLGHNHNVTSQPGHIHPYEGGMDDVRIFSRALDSCEALSLFTNQFDTGSLQIEGMSTITCTGFNDTLTYSSTGMVFDTEWYVNDSLMSTGDSLFISFDSVGAFEVALVHTSDLFCFSDTVEVSYVIHPPDSSFDTLLICNGDSAFLAGEWQSETGWYTDSALTASGCDSLMLTYLDAVYETDTFVVNICAGDSFQVNNVYYNQSGTYLDTVFGAPCDTAQAYQLIVGPLLTDSLSVTVCWGGGYNAGGGVQTQPGIYSDTISAASGCDSVVVTDLQFEYFTDTVALSVCQGDSLEINGFYQSTNGYYPDTLPGNNCDTLRYYHLSTIPPVTVTQNVQVCTGGSYLAGGAMQTTSGTYFDTLQSLSTGCDSIVVINLTFNYEQRVVHHTMCEGESYAFYGTNMALPGTYTHVSSGQNCDTLVTLNLSWTSIQYGQQEIDICHGDSILFGNQWYSEYTIVTDTLLSSLGCDSVRTTELHFYQETSNLDAWICLGEIYAPSGRSYIADTLFKDTVTQGGCIVHRTHHVHVTPPPFSDVNRSICPDDSLKIGGQWHTETGTYADTFFSASTGCDSIRFTHLTVRPFTKEVVEVELCHTDSIFVQGAYQYSGGVYYDTVSNTNEPCNTLIETHVTKLAQSITPPEITVLDSGYCPKPEFLLDAGVNPPGVLWDNNKNTRTVEYQDTGWVHVRYLQCNRVMYDSLYLPWRDCNCYLYFPNTFTPDEDPLERNELFRPLHDCPFYEYELTIYDRWGHTLFQTLDPFESWDGNYPGGQAPIGAYAYQLRYRFAPGAPFLYKHGKVNLLR